MNVVYSPGLPGFHHSGPSGQAVVSLDHNMLDILRDEIRFLFDSLLVLVLALVLVLVLLLLLLLLLLPVLLLLVLPSALST